MRHFRPWLSTFFAICQGHTRIFHPWQIQYSIDCQGRVRFCRLVSIFLARCFHSIINVFRSALSLARYISLRPIFSIPATSSTVLRLQEKRSDGRPVASSSKFFHTLKNLVLPYNSLCTLFTCARIVLQRNFQNIHRFKKTFRFDAIGKTNLVFS